jgi:hypothetical protein
MLRQTPTPYKGKDRTEFDRSILIGPRMAMHVTDDKTKNELLASCYLPAQNNQITTVWIR